MSSLLLIISLLLHIVSFYIIYAMFNQIQQLKNNHTSEITEVLDQYLQDIKRENERLQHELNSIGKTGDTPLADKQYQMNVKSESERIYSEFDSTEFIQAIDTINDSMETSLEARVIHLHKKGLSITDIAKRLDCGKTEAELIIQFYKAKHDKKA